MITWYLYLTLLNSSCYNMHFNKCDYSYILSNFPVFLSIALVFFLSYNYAANSILFSVVVFFL